MRSVAVKHAAHGGFQGVVRRFETRGRQRGVHKSRNERQAFWNWVWNQACSRLEGRLDINIATPLRLGRLFICRSYLLIREHKFVYDLSTLMETSIWAIPFCSCAVQIRSCCSSTISSHMSTSSSIQTFVAFLSFRTLEIHLSPTRLLPSKRHRTRLDHECHDLVEDIGGSHLRRSDLLASGREDSGALYNIR